MRGHNRKAFRSSAAQYHVRFSVHKDIIVLVAAVACHRYRPRTRAEMPQEQQHESSNHRCVTRMSFLFVIGMLLGVVLLVDREDRIVGSLLVNDQ